MIRAIFLAILIMILGESVTETPDIIIMVTPTKETIKASGFTRDNIYYELKEYETTDNIIVSSYKTLNLNETLKLRGRIIGIENRKYLFSVDEKVFDLSSVGNK